MQHETLLRVREEGNAHEKYNSFRSAFEVLETIGKPPADDIEKHYQRPMSLLAKVERLEQELAQPEERCKSTRTTMTLFPWRPKGVTVR